MSRNVFGTSRRGQWLCCAGAPPNRGTVPWQESLCHSHRNAERCQQVPAGRDGHEPSALRSVQAIPPDAQQSPVSRTWAWTSACLSLVKAAGQSAVRRFTTCNRAALGKLGWPRGQAAGLATRAGWPYRTLHVHGSTACVPTCTPHSNSAGLVATCSSPYTQSTANRGRPGCAHLRGTSAN